MELKTLTAKRRSATGKGVARKLRADKLAPAVCYGLKKDPLHLTVEPRSIIAMLKGPLGRNLAFNLAVEGEDEPRLAIMKDMQLHPIRRNILHVDFYEVAADSQITVAVPLRPEGKSAGEKLGGRQRIIAKVIKLSCSPLAIPEGVSVDVTELKIGDMIYAEQLELPEGVELAQRGHVPVLSIVATRDAEDEEDEGEEGEEGEEDSE